MQHVSDSTTGHLVEQHVEARTTQPCAATTSLQYGETCHWWRRQDDGRAGPEPAPALPTVALDADGFADVPLDGSPVRRDDPNFDGPHALPPNLFRGVHAG